MEETIDVVIIGSGPAAYSAALNTTSANLILFEGGIINDIGPGGQLTTTTHVDNYPGFPKGIQGPDLMKFMKKQALDRQITIIKETVVKVTKNNDIFLITTNKNKYKSRAVIVASGASARRLYVPGTSEGEFWQKGISACAVCDGYAFLDRPVAVIGGGDSAMEEVLFLSKISSVVYLIHRRNEFRSRVDKLQEVKKVPNIKILTPFTLESAHGGELLEYVMIKNVETGKSSKLEIDGLFFGIGHIPNVKFLDELGVEIDRDGYLIADEEMRTNVMGLFACGDVCDKKYKQAVTAASSGCIAAKQAMKFLDEKY